MRHALVLCLAIAICEALTTTARAIVITSNDFNSFAAVIASAPAGSTISFDLGSNSTIFFDSSITIPRDMTLVANDDVIFDGRGATTLFGIPTSASVTFSGFTFQNAQGVNNGVGAIFSSGQLNVANSSFLHNHSLGNGGAITASNATIANSFFGFNDAVNTGGAVESNTIAITNSTFFSNQAGNAGGAVSGGSSSRSMLIENSTFAMNHAGNTGGAINADEGTASIRNTTVFGNRADNAGGGIAKEGTGLTVESSLIAGNISRFPDLELSSAGNQGIRNNLIGSGVGTNLTNGANGNIIGDGTNVAGFPIINLLGPLQDNGGPTPTMALLDFGSLVNPAIDKGTNPDALLYDQRGCAILANGR